MGGTESLEISKVGLTVLARLIESQNRTPACQLCVSVWGEFREGTMASVRLDAIYFSSSLYPPLVPFKLLPWC